MEACSGSFSMLQHPWFTTGLTWVLEKCNNHGGWPAAHIRLLALVWVRMVRDSKGNSCTRR